MHNRNVPKSRIIRNMQAESPSDTIRVSTLKPDEVDSDLKKAFERIEKTLGMLPTIYTTMAHFPAAVRPISEAYEAIALNSPVPERIQQIAMIRVSVKNDAPYCLHSHMELGLRAGLTHKQIDALRYDPAGGEFTDKEQLVIEYAERLTESGNAVSDELFSRLRSHFSEEEVISLTLNICLMAFFNRYTDVLKLYHPH